MFHRIALALTVLTIAAPVTGAAPAAAAVRCSTAVAAPFAATWHARGGAAGPLGCPVRDARDGRQVFAHGAVSAAPALGPTATLATYLRDGNVHVALDAVSTAHARYRLQVGASRGDSAFYNLPLGARTATVAAAPASKFASFTVTVYACDAGPMQVLAGPSYVCDHSAPATTVSAPLELAMDPARTVSTGAVALRH